MQAVKRQLEQFFVQYETRMTNALATPPRVDVDATAAAFAECFLEASPLGINCGENNEEFRKAIPQGFEFYRRIGTKSMTIASMTPTQLDEFHWACKVHWVARYEKPTDHAKAVIEFDVIYLMQVIDDIPKVFAYITGDEQRVLEEHGLVPVEEAAL